MAKKKHQPDPSRGRNAAIVPPLGVDFDTALGALLRTPPPPKGEKPARKSAAKIGEKKR
jgi:hypothetical protein